MAYIYYWPKLELSMCSSIFDYTAVGKMLGIDLQNSLAANPYVISELRIPSLDSAQIQ
jgi:hypothetical protein